MRRIAMLLLLALSSLAFAPAPLPKPSRAKVDDLTLLQGEWVLESRLFEGREVGHVVASVEIEGTRWTYLSADRQWKAPGKMILDTSKVPRRLEWEKAHCGVYEVKGDTLIFVFTTDGRHAEIDDLDGTKPGRWREVFKRRR